MGIKKGAMFGLDARIALAIFGALSVISGAALHSAIQEAKMTSFYVSNKEIIKSIEQYYLDHQFLMPPFSPSYLDIRYLIENRDSTSNWKGPYIDCEKGATTDTYGYLYCSGIGTSSLSTYIRPLENGGDLLVCTDVCYLWLFQHVAASKQEEYRTLFTYLDNKYDGGNGALAGNIQLHDDAATYLLFKMMPYNI